MNKKGAVELSMNTIVVVVIAIVLLSLGLVFVRKIMGEVSETSTSAFEAADQEIQELMGGDKAFFVSGLSHEGKVGEKITISAGIQNFLGESMKFKIEIESADDDSDVSWIQTPKEMFVKAGEKNGFPVIVTIPKTARSGMSAFYSVNVYDSTGELYGSEVLAVNVK